MITALRTMYRRLTRILGSHSNVFLLSIALAFTPLRFVSLLLLIFLFGQFFSFITGIGPVSRTILGGLTTVAITAIIALLAWIIGVELSSGLLLIMLALLWIGMHHLVKQSPAKQTKRLVLLDDLVSLGVAVIICMIFLIPFLQNPTVATLGQIVLFNGDNSTHVEIVKANDLNRGNAYGMDNRVNSFVDTASYPQGWHFFIAFTKWLSEPLVSYQTSPGKILLLFYSVSLAWFGVLLFLITRLSIWLGRQLSRGKSPVSVMGALVIVVPIITGWIFTLFSYGFETQIGALVFLLAELFVLSHVMARPDTERLMGLRFALLFAAAVAFMWIFLAPVSVLVVASAYGLTVWQQRKIPWRDVLLAIFLGSLVALQFGFRVLFPLTFEASESFINSNGLVAKSDFTWLAIGSLLVIYIWFIQKAKPLLPIALTLLFGGLFSGGVLWYQYQTIGEARYFFFKANFTLIIVLAIAGGALVMWLVESVIRSWPATHRKTRSLSLAIILLVITLVAGYQVQTPLLIRYFNKTAFGVERRQAEAVLSIVGNDQSAGYRLIAIGSCDRANDIRATQLAWLASFQPLPRNGLFEPMKMFIHDENTLFQKIAEYQTKTGNRPIILVNDQVIGQRFIASLGNQSQQFEVVTIDDDMVDQTADQCPDRIRDMSN